MLIYNSLSFNGFSNYEICRIQVPLLILDQTKETFYCNWKWIMHAASSIQVYKVYNIKVAHGDLQNYNTDTRLVKLGKTCAVKRPYIFALNFDIFRIISKNYKHFLIVPFQALQDDIYKYLFWCFCLSTFIFLYGLETVYNILYSPINNKFKHV